jgi:uncharacterized membrane protein
MGRRSLITASIFLGLGLGGFFDGIVLHQILQWHHIVSVPYPPITVGNLELNTLLDGLFHAVTYIFTVIGLEVLWRTVQRGSTKLLTRTLIGGALLGWGIFNIVEGVIDHHLLQIHHVRSGPNEVVWDLAFLVWGAAMCICGWLLIQVDRREQQTG